MFDFDFYFENASRALEDYVPEGLQLALKLMGEAAEGHAKDGCPVDTGLLRNSITYALGGQAPKIKNYKADNPKKDKDGKVTGTTKGSYSGVVPDENDAYTECVWIGTNVEYAPYVEYNDSSHHDVGHAHFLRNAIFQNGDEYEKIGRTVLDAKNGYLPSE